MVNKAEINFWVTAGNQPAISREIIIKQKDSRSIGIKAHTE